MGLTKFSLWVGIFVGMFALAGGALTLIWQVSPFASKEAQAAADVRSARHEVELQVLKAVVPGIDHKVDALDQKVNHIDEKLDSLNETWNRHIQLEHGGRGR